jgi:hypothetical protein
MLFKQVIGMAFLVEIIFAYMVLIPFIVFNIFILIGLFFQGRVASLIQKFTGPLKNPNGSYYKQFKLFNMIIWIMIGLFFFLTLNNPFSIGGIVVILAFRSGASLSRRFIFGFHDIMIIKKNLSEKKIMKMIIFMIRFSIIIDLLFVLTWGILYRYLSVLITSIFGIEVNFLTLFLWIGGIIYGTIIAVIQSVIGKQFLLKNEIGIALMFSGQVLKEKIVDEKQSLKNDI